MGQCTGSESVVIRLLRRGEGIAAKDFNGIYIPLLFYFNIKLQFAQVEKHPIAFSTWARLRAHRRPGECLDML